MRFICMTLLATFGFEMFLIQKCLPTSGGFSNLPHHLKKISLFLFRSPDHLLHSLEQCSLLSKEELKTSNGVIGSVLQLHLELPCFGFSCVDVGTARFTQKKKEGLWTARVVRLFAGRSQRKPHDRNAVGPPPYLRGLSWIELNSCVTQFGLHHLYPRISCAS